MSISYCGAILDDGREFLTVESEVGYGPIVTVKLTYESFSVEMSIDPMQARELARHLIAAADAVEPIR